MRPQLSGRRDTPSGHTGSGHGRGRSYDTSYLSRPRSSGPRLRSWTFDPASAVSRSGPTGAHYRHLLRPPTDTMRGCDEWPETVRLVGNRTVPSSMRRSGLDCRVDSLPGNRHLEVSPVSRRPDLKRINEARRAAVRNVLIDENRMAATVADAWVREWESEPVAAVTNSTPSTGPSGWHGSMSRRNETAVGRDALGAQDTSASRCPMTTSASATPR